MTQWVCETKFSKKCKLNNCVILVSIIGVIWPRTKCILSRETTDALMKVKQKNSYKTKTSTCYAGSWGTNEN